MEVNPGIYMFNTRWLWENIDKIKNYNAQNEFYLTDLIEIAIRGKIDIRSLPIEPREVLGINTPRAAETVRKICINILF